MRLALFGASGRMGRAVARLAEQDGHSLISLDARADVAIDFSHASAFADVVRSCVDAGVPLVSGTTGLDATAHATLVEAARRVAVLWEPNMSVGVFVLTALVREAAARLGPTFDVEIVEAHHRNKLDAPSGTALRLAEAARAARGELTPSFGRHGTASKRAPNELGMHAVRGGSVVGDHTVGFYGESERLELSHRAESRDVFASGALRAAAWLVGKEPGRYGLGDVLAL